MSSPPPLGSEALGEFDLIRWVRAHTPRPGGSTVLGIGDDAAVVRPAKGSDVVVTTDMLMDGRHFRLDRDGPEAVGYKAMAVNLSDIAAMAAKPVAGVVAVALPRAVAFRTARGVHAGIAEAAGRFGVALVGGDTNAWDGPLVVSVTLLGETTGRGPVPRSGARPGDVIFVTGPLGGSLLGRHLRPSPRVDEALVLHRASPIRALIDISDGLAADLNHILEESGGLGAVLNEHDIPVHPDAVEMGRQDGEAPIEHALHDGEDFELCAVLAREDAERLQNNPPPGVNLVRIGRVIAHPGLKVWDGANYRTLEPAGFDHLRPR
jgi:thiamine-monophosphate kinase